MADRSIGELPAAQYLDDVSLLAVEQQGRAMKFTGAQFKEFAKTGVQSYVEKAKQEADRAKLEADNASKSAADAKVSADNAKQYANNASQSAEEAKQYSGKPPIIQNGSWWIWNAELQQYVDTGEAARGNLMYATFMIDPATGVLWMYTDPEYTGPTFKITNGNLEVILNGHN